MSTDRVSEWNKDTERVNLLSFFVMCMLVLPPTFFASVPILLAQTIDSYVVIDQHVFPAQSIPTGYERFIKEALETDRITVETGCRGDAPSKNNMHPCVISFFPKYPYHHIPRDAKKKLVTEFQAAGGTFLDWAFSEGKFWALGWGKEGYFQLIWLDSQADVHFSAQLDVANGDVQSEFGIDSPDAKFCTDPPARLLLPWDQSALVGCVPYRSTSIEAFFVFPVRYVHQWWSKSEIISGKRAIGETRPLLADIFWEGWFESDSSKVRIPATYIDNDLTRYQEIVTLDLETGEFFNGGQRIFPDLSSGETKPVPPSPEKTPSAVPHKEKPTNEPVPRKNSIRGESGDETHE